MSWYLQLPASGLFLLSLALFAQDFLATLASQAYVESAFSVCADLTSGKRNHLCKKLANRAFLKRNNKFYD